MLNTAPMRAQDRFALTITNATPADAAGYDSYVREFLSYGSRLRELFAVADAAPAAALLNAHAAALHLAFEGAEGWAHAAPYLDRMRSCVGQASERERQFCAAVEAWASRDYWRARDILDAMTVRWPADLCAIKWGQYHAFNLGDAGALLRFGERARIVFENEPYANGLLAFALEQNHRLDEAEETGRRASELAIDDAWAHHAVAHVMETQGRAEEGARWLERCSHTWEKKGVFIRDHNWWHAALFQLTLGREDEALRIYDARLWGAWPEFPQEQIGAISMLWRLEMRGADVGERWLPIVAQVRRRAGEHILPFHDLHYLYALARAGAEGEACAFMTSLKAHAETASVSCKDFWRGVGIPAAEGVLAFAQNDCAHAAGSLAQALPDLHLAGGSHAQRHVFVEAFEQASTGDPRGRRRAS